MIVEERSVSLMQISQENERTVWLEAQFAWGESGCGEGAEELDGECVHVRGFVVGACLLNNRVGAVKVLFRAVHHPKELVVQVVNIVVPSREDYPIEEVLGRWRGVGSDCRVNFSDEYVEIGRVHRLW